MAVQSNICRGWERTHHRKQTFHPLHLHRALDSGSHAGQGQPLALERNASPTHLEDVSSARKVSLSGHVAPKHKFIVNDFLVNSRVQNNSVSGNRSCSDCGGWGQRWELTDLSKCILSWGFCFCFLSKEHIMYFNVMHLSAI